MVGGFLEVRSKVGGRSEGGVLVDPISAVSDHLVAMLAVWI